MTSRWPRLVWLMTAGLVDSLCLSFAWTVLMLHVVADYGLAAAGMASSAMLVGVALSAPVAGRLSVLLEGRRLLRGTAGLEAVLRVGVFVLLIGHAPLLLLAGCVSLMNVTAWTGYAAMRAEVAAASPGSSALTWYGAGVAAVEAVGAAFAALLPLVADVEARTVLLVVAGVYVLGLAPTALVAGGSPVPRSARPTGRRTRPGRTQVSLPVAAGFVLMFLAAAPTLLAVGLAAQLHGRASVAVVAVAFTVGSLAAPALSWQVQRRGANHLGTWLLCAGGMVAGWAFAPAGVVVMCVAQAASGLTMTALEGLLDTSTAARAGSGVTGALARATASRALGAAAATTALPAAMGTAGLTVTAASATAVLLLGALALRVLAPGLVRARKGDPVGAGSGAGVPRTVPRVGLEPTLDGV